MEYNVIPALYVGVESGNLKGPGKGASGLTSVETLSTAELFSSKSSKFNEDKTRNVVVITFENLFEKAQNRRSMMQLALKVSECREVVRDVLVHLAAAGDDVAKYLLSQLAQSFSGGSSSEESSGEESSGEESSEDEE